MFNFLNRNESIDTRINKVENTVINSNSAFDSLLQSQINEAKKNLYDSIKLHRTDIVVSFLNEWFKGKIENE
jgi:hypothetical protein